MNAAHEFLRSRRSVRRFKPDPVPQAVVERLLTTAIHAPSAHNRQPWRFVIIRQSEARCRLEEALITKMRADMRAEGAAESEIEARAANSRRRIQEAPLLVLLCRDLTDVRVDTPEEATMAVQSVAAAGLQLLLAAHAEGLGGNWICWPLYARAETRDTLGLPDTWEPQAMLIIGAQAEAPKEKKLKAILEVVRYID